MDTKMSRLHVGVVIVLTLLLVLALALSLRRQKTEAVKGPDVGGAAKSASRSKLAREQALAGFLKTMKLEGKAVLIEFGIVGCELSGSGYDGMAAHQQANDVPGLAFVRVEGHQDEAVVKEYFEGKSAAIPIHSDRLSALAKSLGATAYPTFLLVDRFGHVRYQGRYPEENLVQWATALAAEARDPGPDAPMFGAKAVDVSALLANRLPDVRGVTRPLSEYMGKGGLMVLFVDTRCPFSATASKELPTVARALAGQNVNAVLLNCDDDEARVKSFYSSHGPGVPVLYDTGAATREAWGVHSVPVAVYISPAVKIVYQGEAVWANVGEAVESSLGLASGAVKFTSAGTGFG